MALRHIIAVADLRTVNSACKSILFNLAIECDDAGIGRLDREKLRLQAAVSERSLRDHLTTLREAGLLAINSTQYALTLPLRR